MNRNVNRFKSQIVITGIAVFAVVISMIGGSYAIFSSSASSGEYNVITAGNLEISYVEGEDGYGDILSLNGAYPMSDTEGVKGTPYRFNITNTGDIALDYRIKIEYDEAIIQEDGCGPIDSENNKLLDMNYVKYQFNSTGTPAVLGDTTDHIIYDSVKDNQPGLQPGDSKIYEIRIWIAEGAPNSVLGKHFHGKVVVESIQSGVDMKLATEYKIGDAVTLVDDSTWHVLKNASGTSATVTLIKDENVTTRAFDTEDNRLVDTNTYCTNDSYGCNMYDNNGSTVIKDSSIKTWLEEEYLNILKTAIVENNGTIEDLTIFLPSMEEIVAANANSSKKFNQTVLELDKDFLKTSSTYWTKTAVKGTDTSYVWYINGDKSALAYANNTEIGVRPVIVTSKLNIK